MRLCERGIRRGAARRASRTRVNEIGRAVEREVRRRGFTVVARTHRPRRRPDHSRAAVGAERIRPRQRDVLTEGLVLTIEPMISAGSSRVFRSRRLDDRTRDGSLAAHYEHTIVITRDAPVVLTGSHAA